MSDDIKMLYKKKEQPNWHSYCWKYVYYKHCCYHQFDGTVRGVVEIVAQRNCAVHRDCLCHSSFFCLFVLLPIARMGNNNNTQHITSTVAIKNREKWSSIPLYMSYTYILYPFPYPISVKKKNKQAYLFYIIITLLLRMNMTWPGEMYGKKWISTISRHIWLFFSIHLVRR